MSLPPRVAGKRGVAEQALKQNAAGRPKIAFFGITLLPQNFHCSIILRSDGAKRLQATVPQLRVLQILN